MKRERLLARDPNVLPLNSATWLDDVSWRRTDAVFPKSYYFEFLRYLQNSGETTTNGKKNSQKTEQGKLMDLNKVKEIFQSAREIKFEILKRFISQYGFHGHTKICKQWQVD